MDGNELVLCEGTLFNKDGTIRWRVEGDFDHGQTIAVAKLREDYAGKQVIIGERNIGNIYCYSADGKPIDIIVNRNILSFAHSQALKLRHL